MSHSLAFSIAANWPLPIHLVIHILAVAMMRRFRSLVILLTALAFSVTSVGWAMESGSMALNAANGHHRSIEATHSSGQHKHRSNDGVQRSTCLQATGVACDTDHHPGDPAKSCCGALACHAAIPVSSCTATVIAFVRAIEPLPLEIGIKEASGTRLDRPPRSVDL